MSNLEYLYVIEFKNGTIKVGRSAQVQKRLAQHQATALAHGNPVLRSWISDGHEDSVQTEAVLLNALGEPSIAAEWFVGLDFGSVVASAKNAVHLSTDSELYWKRLRDAQAVIQAHTGNRVPLDPTPADQQEVLDSFVLSEGQFVMSSAAFEHYLNEGGRLNRKAFLAALQMAGVERRRSNEGTRLYGIMIP